MNVLFFIGNGFDLNIGIKTRFKDVLSLYIKEASVDLVIGSFKESINQNIKTWSNFEEKIGSYSDEMEKKETPIETFPDFSKCNLDFKKFLKSYLKEEENKVNYDDEKNISRIFKYSLLNFTKCLNINQNIFFDETDKTTIRYSYISFNYTSVFDKCLEILKKSNVFQLEKRIKTGFFRNVIFAQNDLGNVFHVHGTLDNNMILGVNDLMQIKNPDFHNIEKVNRYIKPKVNDLLENQKNAHAKKLIEEAITYCIFGMSLGKTDKVWWIEICKQLINNSGKRLIIYAYDENLDDSFPENTLETIDYYKIIFLNHLQFSELDKDDIKEKIKKSIHVVIDKEIFQMKLT